MKNSYFKNKKQKLADFLAEVFPTNGQQCPNIIDFFPDPILGIDKNKRVIIWNKSMEQMTGVKASKMLGRGNYEYMVPFYGKARPSLMNLFWEPGTKKAAGYAAIKKEGDNYVIENFCPALRQGQGAYIWAKASPLRDSKGKFSGAIECVRDVTDRRLETLELQQKNRALEILSASDQTLIHAKDEAWLLNEVCRIIIKLGNYRFAWIGFKEEDEDKTIRPVAAAGLQLNYLKRIKVTWADNTLGKGPSGLSIRTGKVAVSQDVVNDPKMKPWRKDALRRGYRSSIAFPLTSGNQVFGTLGIYSDQVNAFHKQEIKILQELADDLAFGITALRLRLEHQKLETEFKTIFDTSSDGLLVANPNNKSFLLANSAMCRMLGYTSEEMQTMSIADIHPDTAIRAVTQQFQSLVQGKQTLARDVPIKRRDGSIFYVDINSSLFKLSGQNYILGIFRDVTESKERERLLRENDERYRITMRQTGQLIYEYLIDSGKINWLGAIEAVTDYSAKEFSSVDINKWAKMVHPEDRKEALSALAKAQQAVSKYDVEYRFRQKGGRYIFVRDRGVFIGDSRGRAVKMFGVMQDITARIEFEDKLKLEKNKLQEYLDAADVILLSLDKNQRVISINKKGCEALGYSEREIIGKNWFDNFIPQKDTLRVKEVFTDIVKGKLGKFSRFENPIITKSGEERVIAWNNKIIKDSKGRFVSILSSGDDVTQHKRYEDKIKESEKKYSTLVENSGDGVVVIQDGVFKFANRTVAAMTGFTVEEVMNKPMIDFIDPKFRALVAKRYQQRMAGLSPINRYELSLLTRNRESMPVEINSSIIDFDGRKADMAIIRDISRAKQIDKIKSEFISVASHQLRSPLTGIKWFGQLLIDGKVGSLSDKQLDFIQQIYNSNERMIRLVNDLLDVSHIETGQKFSINKKSGEIISLIKAVITEQKLTSPAKNIIIEIDKNCPSKVTFKFDQDKIYQVFSNLINNSIKYSPQDKKVIIGVKCLANGVQFWVRDFGFGIPERQKNQVFQKFFRGDNIVTVSTEGTGLGLYIAKSIIEAHGGAIWFESRQNKGTTFYFTLPKR